MTTQVTLTEPPRRRHGPRGRAPAARAPLRPSLVLDPSPALGIAAEEQFGPALPVLPYDDEEQAIFTETHVMAVPAEASE